MNRRLFILALMAALGAWVVPASVFAQQVAPPQLAGTPTTRATQPAVDGHHAKQRAVPAPGSRLCLRATGSHIRPPKGRCLPVPGTTYSAQDIQRTGATNLGQALQMLDPSVTAGGH